MDERKLKKLRQFYHSLINLQKVFDDLTYADIATVQVLQTEVKKINEDFPELLPEFNLSNYRLFKDLFNFQSTDCSLPGIRAYIGVALGRLKVAIDEPTITPVTEKRGFDFVNNIELRQILKRDFSEIQRVYISECWKSVIILCGGAIEAILTDLLLANELQAKAASKAPKTSDITRWDLSNLIDVSVELNLVSPGVEKLSHSLREYRNLVHPGNEIRNRLTFDAEEARIALEVLNILYRDLSS